MKPLGYVRQEYYDHSLTPAEFKRKTDNVTRSVRTVCDYNRGDAHRTSVQVTVEQYRSDKVARSEWASIAYLGTGKESRKLAKRDFSGPSWDFNWIAKLARENERDMGGKRVKGIDDVLFVRGRADFVGFRHNALVRVSYLPLSFVTPVFSAGAVPRAGRQGQSARSASSTSSWTAPTSPSGPLGPAINGEREVNGVPYLDPCSVLNENGVRARHRARVDQGAPSRRRSRFDAAGLREAGDDRYDQDLRRRRRAAAPPATRSGRGAPTSRYDHADLCRCAVRGEAAGPADGERRHRAGRRHADQPLRRQGRARPRHRAGAGQRRRGDRR